MSFKNSAFKFVNKFFCACLTPFENGTLIASELITPTAPDEIE